jgi:hypothetical protein
VCILNARVLVLTKVSGRKDLEKVGPYGLEDNIGSVDYTDDSTIFLGCTVSYAT